jgi:hypothetical protein
MRWFGGFDGMKLFGILFLSAFSLMPWYMFDQPLWWWSGAIWLMLSTAFIDGVTAIDLESAQLRRSIRFLWVIPIWRRTTHLRERGELHVTFKPSWKDRWNKWHERDFTRIDLRFGPRDWVELAQTDRSRGNFDETLLARARKLASTMGLRLVVDVERVASAVEHKDESARFPPLEMRDNKPFQPIAPKAGASAER